MASEQEKKITEDEAISAIISSTGWIYIERKIMIYFHEAANKIDESRPLVEIGAEQIAIKRFKDAFERFLIDSRFTQKRLVASEGDPYR